MLRVVEEKMTSRSADDVARALRPREQVNYLEEESDGDVDFIEDKESSGSAYSCSDESDEDIRPERNEQKERVPRAGSKYLYGKNGHKWYRDHEIFHGHA